MDFAAISAAMDLSADF